MSEESKSPTPVYIAQMIKNIDKLIYYKDYLSAFQLFLMVADQLKGDALQEFVRNYSNAIVR